MYRLGTRPENIPLTAPDHHMLHRVVCLLGGAHEQKSNGGGFGAAGSFQRDGAKGFNNASGDAGNQQWPSSAVVDLKWSGSAVVNLERSGSTVVDLKRSSSTVVDLERSSSAVVGLDSRWEVVPGKLKGTVPG